MTLDPAMQWTVLLTISAMMSLALVVINIWDRLRRKPSIDQTLLYYLRREEYTEHCKQNDAVTKELFTLLREQSASMGTSVTNLHKDLGEWQRGIAYQIGCLDGRVDKIERNPS